MTTTEIILLKSFSEILADHTYGIGSRFVQMFEGQAHVYFVFSEPSVETVNIFKSEGRIYSRIARVCKNDKGRGSAGPIFFATLFKARLLCGSGKQVKKTDWTNRDSGEFYGYESYINEIGKKKHMSYIYR